LYHKRNTSENEYKRKEKGYVKSFETNEYIHTIRKRAKTLLLVHRIGRTSKPYYDI
jgi:hypothetical protein